MRCLEIGPGEERLGREWITVDCLPRPKVVDYVCSWGEEPLPFASGSFAIVYASHVLEHIPWYRTISALCEVFRILHDGGTLEVHVPDLDVLIRGVQQRRCLDPHTEQDRNGELHWMHWVAERLFHMEPEHQWHRACFNEDHLAYCLRRAGFCDVKRIETERGPGHGVINLGMCATK